MSSGSVDHIDEKSLTQLHNGQNKKDFTIHSVVSLVKDDIGKGDVLTTFISPSGKQVKITDDVDEAMALALDAEQNHLVYDPVADKRLLRKIDWYLLPLLCFLYCCQFMDKITNGSAAILGMIPDLKMTGDMFSWSGTAFYIGYLVFEFPVTLLLQRFHLTRTISLFIIMWGIVLTLHAVPNYGGFIFLRTMLGVFESAISPGMVIITGQWYRKEEQFLRTALWFCCNGLGSILCTAISYACLVHGEKFSIAPWKVLFIITGVLTIIVGIAFYIHIPPDPSKAWFLSKQEKLMVIARIKNNKQGFGNKHFKKYQFIEALKDPLTWLFFLYAVASDIPNGSLTNFASILLNSDFGFDLKQTLLMGLPGGAVEIVGCALFAYCHKFIPHRMGIAVFAQVVVFVCSCMFAFIKHNKNARLAGYYLLTISPIGMICCLSCFQSNTAGHTKKVTTTAIFLIGYSVGNLIGPQTFIASQAPSYVGGKIAIVVGNGASTLLVMIIYLLYWAENKRRDKKLAEVGDEDFKAIQNSEFADLTDRENPAFRYSL